MCWQNILSRHRVIHERLEADGKEGFPLPLPNDCGCGAASGVAPEDDSVASVDGHVGTGLRRFNRGWHYKGKH